MKRIFIAFTLVIFLFSCEFDPNGSHEVDVNPPKVPDHVTIDLNDVSDTLIVVSSTDVRYSIEAGEMEIIGGEVTLGDQLISAFKGGKGTFTIEPRNYKNGYYELKVSFNAKTGSGSLADELGAEVLKGERTWIFGLDSEPPKTLNIERIYPEGGRLKIVWPPYQGISFDKYVIYHGDEVIQEIYNRNQTSCYDSIYVGGKAYFSLIVMSKNGQTRSESYLYEQPYPVIEILSYTDTSAILSWQKTLFYNNFHKYVLYVNNVKMASIYEVDSTTFSAKMTFGWPVYFSVGVDHTDLRYTPHGSAQEAYIGVRIGDTSEALRSNNDIRYSQSNNSFYFLAPSGSIYRTTDNFDLISKYTSMGCCSSFFDISENGQYLYAGGRDKLLQIDPISFEILATYSTEELFGNFELKIHGVHVSNNNQVLLKLRRFFYSVSDGTYYDLDDSVKFIEFGTSEPRILTVGEHTKSNTNLIDFSSNGDLIIHDGQLIKVDQDFLEYQTEIPNQSIFSGDNSETIISVVEQGPQGEAYLQQLSLPSLSETYKHVIPEAIDNLSFDNQYKLVSGREPISDSFYVYDLINGTRMKKLYYKSNYKVQHGILFSSTGYYLPISSQ